jgi:hypothetical protein
MLRKLLPIALVAGLLVLAAGQAQAAGNASHLSSGGTASISQVAMNVKLDGTGSASGASLRPVSNPLCYRDDPGLRIDAAIRPMNSTRSLGQIRSLSVMPLWLIVPPGRPPLEFGARGVG